MKRKWWLVPIILAVIGVLWIMASDTAYLAPLQTAIGLKPANVERAKSKPICSSPVNPNVAVPTDCIPQHLANLPPDPGEAGNRTIEGIDSDKDGVRDDVQRKIEEKYGESRRAVAALRLIAMQAQEAVMTGDSLGREEAYQVAIKRGADIAACYVFTVKDEIRHARAAEHATAWVLNTRERNERYRAFDNLMNNRVFLASDVAIPEACGYDPAALPN
jgi:hypothetical protein